MYYSKIPINEETVTKDIEIINQTRRYLIPQFKEYGIELLDRIRSLNIKGVFVQDFGVNVTPEARTIKPEVYFLFDVNGALTYGHYHNVKQSRIDFMEALQYFRSKPYYVVDYPFDSNKDGHLHVVVMKLPKPETLKPFLEGNYSKIYTEDQIEQWIPKEIKVVDDGKEQHKRTVAYQVLTKDPEYFEIFQNKVKEEFGTRDSSVNPKGELDFPPYIPNEVLRYDK